MNLSIELQCILRQRGTEVKRPIEEAAKLAKAAGFNYVDYTPDFKCEDWKEKAKHDREVLDAYGITVEQTHAPMGRYRQHDMSMFYTYYDRVFEASAILGAKYVVCHGDEYCTSDHWDEKEILEFTYDYLAPRVDFAVKHGMGVAVENLFEDSVKHCPQIDGKSRFTSRVHELAAIIERFNTPDVSVCWDFGHAACAFGFDDMLSQLKVVGKYLTCTHVHDNYYDRDLHLLPFLGKIKWEEHMAYLKEIGYKGNFNFEFAYGWFPDALLPQWLDMVHTTGEYLINL